MHHIVWIACGILLLGGVPGPALAAGMVKANPNPLRPASGTSKMDIQVDNPSSSCTVKLAIYDLSTRVVYKFPDRTGVVSSITVQWDGRDASGRAVKSGVYILRFQRSFDDGSKGDEQEKMRVAVIW